MTRHQLKTEVKERGILFSAPMVRALLDGRKTQTRRIAKWRPREAGLNLGFSGLEAGYYCSDVASSGWVLRSRGAGGCWNDRTHPLHCPYGAPGDRLWVRETWQAWNQVSVEYDEWDPITREVRMGESWAEWIELRGNPDAIEYRATSESVGPWTPAIHMPRWASRITLEVTGVRVERLHAITGRDVLAEGVDNGKSNPAQGKRWENMQRLAFEELWREINGAESWAANPWVWVVEFKRIEHVVQPRLTEGRV